MSLDIFLNKSNGKQLPKTDKKTITSSCHSRNLPKRKQLRKTNIFLLPQDDNNSSNSGYLTLYSDESSEPELGNAGAEKTPVDRDPECLFCDGKFFDNSKGDLRALYRRIIIVQVLKM